MKVTKENAIKAYKVFNQDWTCREFKYEVGETYHQKGTVIPCENGFHACQKLIDCFNYYKFSDQPKIAVVRLWGTIVREGDKLCASNIAIDAELGWREVLDAVNTGAMNTGYSNSGNHNSGNNNSGDHNSGYFNSGHWNSGYGNSGDYNSGGLNSGNTNSGSWNSGNWNSGDWNSGAKNSGDCNSGVDNSGDRNSGNRNAGYCNSGNWNSGDHNSGNHNSGDWNSGDHNSGYFNTNAPDRIRVFNKPTQKKDIDWPRFLFFCLNTFVPFAEMSDEEKAAHPEAVITGGYLRALNYKEVFRSSFLKAKEQEDWPEERKKLLAIPNFDFKIFEEISGIKKEEILEGMITKTKKGKKK